MDNSDSNMQRRLAVLTALYTLLLSFSAVCSASTYVIHTSPQTIDAAVLIDGIKSGITDRNGKAIVDASSGEHRVQLTENGRTIFDGVLVFDSVINLLEIEISKDSPGTQLIPNDVVYLIRAGVDGASITVDGRMLATTTGADGAAQIRLETGREYTVSVSRRGYEDKTAGILAAPGGGEIELFLTPLGDGRSTVRQTDRSTARGLPVVVGAAFAFLLVSLCAMVLVLLRKLVKDSKPRSGGAPDLRPKATQEIFDQFSIKGVLGSGGVATVFDAVDSTGRNVALKVLDKKWLNDPEMVAKFLSEAEALSSVRRMDSIAPVVRVLGSGREDGKDNGLPFIILELLHGEDLAQRIKKAGCLGEREVVGIGLQIASALTAMKDAGVVHRDLTPDNIFLVRGEARFCENVLTGIPRVVLIDFGVARQEFLARVTMDGSIAGKPPYMSPEQCRGETVDFRSDLYALGLVLFAAISGAPPFTGNNPFEVMKAQENDAPPSLNNNVSPALKRLITELLEKQPAKRPKSPQVVAERLADLFEFQTE